MTGCARSLVKMDNVLYFAFSRYRSRRRIDGVNRFAREHGWNVHLVERAFDKMSVKALLDEFDPIGVIAGSPMSSEGLMVETTARLPVVYLDTDDERFSRRNYVGMDNESVGRMAATHLLKLGLRNFAYVPFVKPVFWDQRRRETFLKTITAAGFGCSVFHVASGGRVEARLRKLHAWLRDLPRSCGVFTSNDYMGSEIINASVKLGVKIPEEMAVLSVDNDELVCENLPISLSSIQPGGEEGGYLAAAMLHELIRNPGRDVQQQTYSVDSVVVRQSSRRFFVNRATVNSAVEMIRLQACNGIRVPDVVKCMGMPRRTAELYFREVTGRSILEEINEVRFQKVFELLKNPRQQLQVIADLCGFGTPSALRKAFLLRTGMSMRDWRNRM